MNSKHARMLEVTAFAFLIGCGGAPLPVIGGQFSPTKSFRKKTQTPEGVSLYLVGEELPQCKFSRVGIARYNANAVPVTWPAGRKVYGTDTEALQGFKPYLASLGVDGALDVRCAGAGTQGYGICEGIAFVCDEPASAAGAQEASAGDDPKPSR